MKTIYIMIIAGITLGISACTAITDITSSTSSTLDTVTPDLTLNNFIDKRYDAIRQDAAAGGGENIKALADLMGKGDAESLAIWMQTNYQKLFFDEATSHDLIARIKNLKQQNKT